MATSLARLALSLPFSRSSEISLTAITRPLALWRALHTIANEPCPIARSSSQLPTCLGSEAMAGPPRRQRAQET